MLRAVLLALRRHMTRGQALNFADAAARNFHRRLAAGRSGTARLSGRFPAGCGRRSLASSRAAGFNCGRCLRRTGWTHGTPRREGRRQCATNFPRRSSRYGREAGITRSRPASRAGHPTPGPSIATSAGACASSQPNFAPPTTMNRPPCRHSMRRCSKIGPLASPALSPPRYPRSRNCFPRNALSGLSSVTFSPYIQGAGATRLWR
jgi:hypothetical protein